MKKIQNDLTAPRLTGADAVGARRLGDPPGDERRSEPAAEQRAGNSSRT